MANVYDFTLPNLAGSSTSIGDYAGKALLIVNVASECGLTPQYEGLEALYKKREGDGLVVLGFPCNQFGGQEPGTEAEIQTFCSTKYDVTFPLFGKLDVNGESKHPLYAYLTSQDTKPQGPDDITWNFEKFVVGRDGQVIARFDPSTAPDNGALLQSIQSALEAAP